MLDVQRGGGFFRCASPCKGLKFADERPKCIDPMYQHKSANSENKPSLDEHCANLIAEAVCLV